MDRLGDTLSLRTLRRTDRMTDTSTTDATPEVGAATPTDAAAAPADAAAASADAPFDAEKRATELAILDALRSVVDPEIGMNVVELALIKQILLGPDSTEVKMILTTPFCPYAGSMIAQVKEQTETVVDHDVKVTLLAERWDPRDAGLMW
jgi:metal-sulfur cluster biosynthetic enzyme